MKKVPLAARLSMCGVWMYWRPDAAAQRVRELLVGHHDQDVRPCGGAAERGQERRSGGGFQEGSPVHNNPGSTSITGRRAVDCGYARFRRIHCGFLSCCYTVCMQNGSLTAEFFDKNELVYTEDARADESTLLAGIR